MKIAAFIGWQSGAGGEKNLHDYYKSMNLIDEKPELSKEAKKILAGQALDKAKNIISMMNKGTK